MATDISTFANIPSVSKYLTANGDNLNDAAEKVVVGKMVLKRMLSDQN